MSILGFEYVRLCTWVRSLDVFADLSIRMTKGSMILIGAIGIGN